METYSSKRRRESMNQSCVEMAKRMAKRTMRKLDFSMDMSSSPVVRNPQIEQFNIDDNSCGSAFSDHSDTSSLDTSQNESQSLNLISALESPFRFTQRLSCSKQSATNRQQQQSNPPKPQPQLLHLKEKSKSDSFFENAQHIMRALDQSLAAAATATTTMTTNSSSHSSHHNALVGDLTRHQTLPTLPAAKHRDLASISAQTLVELIEGKYAAEIADYAILDARYPYEYQGGHIDGAENACLNDALFERLFRDTSQRPKVLIIHCEFSSERGPKLMREIRERDRILNKHAYPSLYYPEMYLLEGGYKCFYEQFSVYCTPQAYLPMCDDNYRSELKYFRKKSKTWEVETKRRASHAKLTKYISF